jgi:hypothetical protein
MIHACPTSCGVCAGRHCRNATFWQGSIRANRRFAIRLLGGLRARLWQLFVAPDTITFILPESDWRSISPAFPRARVERPYRVVSFEIDLPPDLTGFLAVISAALAAASVPIVAISGFSRDHLLVREADLDRTLATLDALVSSAAAEN